MPLRLPGKRPLPELLAASDCLPPQQFQASQADVPGPEFHNFFAAAAENARRPRLLQNYVAAFYVYFQEIPLVDAKRPPHLKRYHYTAELVYPAHFPHSFNRVHPLPRQSPARTGLCSPP